jgi:hypothetical protein
MPKGRNNQQETALMNSVIASERLFVNKKTHKEEENKEKISNKNNLIPTVNSKAVVENDATLTMTQTVQEKSVETPKKKDDDYNDVFFQYQERFNNQKNKESPQVTEKKNDTPTIVNNDLEDKQYHEDKSVIIMHQELENNQALFSKNKQDAGGNVNSNSNKNPAKNNNNNLAPNDINKETSKNPEITNPNSTNNGNNKIINTIDLDAKKIKEQALNIFEHFEIVVGEYNAELVFSYKQQENIEVKLNFSNKVNIAIKNLNLVSNIKVKRKHGTSFSLGGRLHFSINHKKQQHSFIVFSPLLGSGYIEAKDKDQFVTKSLHGMNAADMKNHFLISWAPNVDLKTQISNTVVNFSMDFDKDKKKHASAIQVKHLLANSVPISIQLMEKSLIGVDHKSQEQRFINIPAQKNLTGMNFRSLKLGHDVLGLPPFWQQQGIVFDNHEVNNKRIATVYSFVFQGKTPEILSKNKTLQKEKTFYMQSLLMDLSIFYDYYKEEKWDTAFHDFKVHLSLPAKIKFSDNIDIEVKIGINFAHGAFHDCEEKEFKIYTENLNNKIPTAFNNISLPLSLEIKIKKIKFKISTELNIDAQKLTRDKPEVFNSYGVIKKNFFEKLDVKLSAVDLTSEKRFIIRNADTTNKENQYHNLIVE